MTKLYVGEVELAPETVESLSAAGFTVVNEKAPVEPEPGDLTLIGADPGITSSLRHEVNNPLTAVLGFTQLLMRRPDLDADVVERLSKVHEHAVRVRDLIQKPDPADG
jgi:nitrogen-specific signal transduction histidine kinase